MSESIPSPVSPREVLLIPPVKHRDLVLKKPEDKAAGMTAVKEAIRHLRQEMGFVSGMRVVGQMNQKDGFDCSGCAWPDPKERSSLGEYCENGAKALAEEATEKRVDPEFFARHSVEELSAWPDYELGKAGRITEPMVLRSGSSHYEPISWDEAFSAIATELNSLASPDEAIFYTSGRTSNEAAFMYQLFVRAFGTNNMPDCSNMCHETSGTGLSATLGIGKGSVLLEDLYEAELIMVMGQNPGTNHPRMLTALKKCKENGGKIISINPLDEAGLKTFVDPQSPMNMLRGGTSLADMWLPVRINGDVALLKGLMRLMLDAEDAAPGTIFDHAFIEAKSAGYETFIADLRQVSVDECVENSGISRKQMEQVAKLLMKKKKIIICWAMGLTQHKNGVGNIQEIVNLLLLRGAIGKPGAGTCPVRGHSNVQGDRTMGVWEKPKEPFLAALDKHFGMEAPRPHGFDTVDSIEAMRDGKAHFFMGMGGNFVSATPDSAVSAAAMQKCRMTVQVSTKLNRSHVITGDTAFILPCIARSEADVQEAGPQFVTVENSMGIVTRSKGFTKAASKKLMSEPAIVAGLGKAVFGPNAKIDWGSMVQDYDHVREHIEATIPGFTNYNKRVREPNGFALPNGAREGNFSTPDGKAHFTVNPIPEHQLEDGQFVLMTIRSHDQYNTTIYGLHDRYRGIQNERRVILMHPEDIKARGWKAKQVVDITSHFEGETRMAPHWLVVPYEIPRRCLAAYFPEANVLVPIRSVAEKSNTPVSKFVVVTLDAGE